jgi:plastocyanin
MRKITGLFGALILVLTTVSCGGSTAPGGGGGGGGGGGCPANTFCMTSTTYTPTARTVTAGTAVTWQNDSGVIHDVIWDNATASAAAGAGDGSGDIGDFSSGSHSRVFNTPGTYGFHCIHHAPGMTGTLTIQ